MLSINTNLSSLIVQGNLKQSTNSLNTAIERMTTGCKLNHASDNAANYSIKTNMDTKIGACQVAEDNAMQAIDLVETASGNLAMIEDRLSRLRMLQEQALNGTYGEESRNAINMECNSLVDEINRLYLTTEYNGINLFLETTQDENGNNQILLETTADETTTLKDLGIETSSFSVYDSTDTLIQTYDVEETDTIGDIFTILQTYGFTLNIQNGQITISSTNGSYISGDLAVALGIETQEKSYVSSTNQTSSTPMTYESISSTTTEVVEYTTATTSTTTTEVVYTTTTTSTTQTNTITNEIETTTYEIESEELMATSTAIVTGTATADTTLAQLGLDGDYTIGGVEVSGADSVGTVVTKLTSAGVSASFANGVLSIGAVVVDSTKRVANVSSFTSGETYYISTKDDLVALGNALYNNALRTSGVTFVLTNDIDMSGVNNFIPIGYSSNSFQGVFEGNGYAISNLTVTAITSGTGLFGDVKNATIRNLGVENVNISLSTIASQIGALVGYAVSSTIESCYTTGSIRAYSTDGASWVGGLVGRTFYADINNCYSSCNVKVYNSDWNTDIGGFVGAAVNVTIKNSYSSGDVTGVDSVGGFAGSIIQDSIIQNCFSKSNSVIGASNAGGFAGAIAMTQITNCYSLAKVQLNSTVDATGPIGGFAGTGYSNCTVNNCSYNSETNTSGNGDSSGASFTGLSPLQINLTFTDEYLGFTEANGWTRDASNNLVLMNPAAQMLANASSELVTGLGLISSSGSIMSNTLIYTLPPVVTTATLSTTFAELGLTGSNKALLLDNLGNTIFAGTITSTLQNAVDAINSIDSFNANFANGFLNITTGSERYLDMNSTFFDFVSATNAINTITSTVETTETETIWTTTTTETTKTETTYHTTTSSQTRTETLFSTTTLTATGSTTFGQMGASGFNVNVFTDGTLSTLNIGSDLSIADFLTQLSSKGITATESGGIVALNGVGDSYVSSSVLSDLFNLGTLNKTTATKTVNTKSDEQRCTVNILDRLGGNVYAPGEINLQVGVTGEESSQLTLQTSFQLTDYDEMRRIGTDEVNRLEKIDEMLSCVSEKQTELGAAQNRLMSVLEEINVQYENLVSSRSTIQDADMGEVSATYIQQQILQQASATLMATANQTPAIALQLI